MSAPIPKVTVVIAAYNSVRTMERCIRAVLAQDYPDFDVVVVDNNSTDSTAAIVKRYPVTYLFESKKGWPAARNTGIAHADGQYVANIDADCFPTPSWITNLMKRINETGVGCVVGKTLVEEGVTFAQKYYASTNPFSIEHKIGKTGFVPWGGGNNVMNRDAFLKAGGYDSDRFTSGADIDMHMRMERLCGLRTVFEESALIHHEARGSVREFYEVAAKYAHGGYMRSRDSSMSDSGDYFRLFALRNAWQIVRHAGGMIVRSIKALAGRDTWFRVASNWFAIIGYAGTIHGYLKAKREPAAASCRR
ncbi:MAG: glycosyltransferase family 2 protein [Nitrospirae bacterium]|nr:glycosyltransferase family 2 protein [Nitrospirota bacterium]